MSIAEFAQHLHEQGKSVHTVRAYAADLQLWGGRFDNPADAAMRANAIRCADAAPRSIARWLASHAAYARYTGIDASFFMSRPTVGVVLPTVVPTPAEMRTLLAAENDPQYRAAFALMAGAGLRISEVLSLDWANWHADSVRVLGKGSKLRDVPLSQAVKDAVWPWLATRPMTEPIFTKSARSMQRRIKVTAQAAGLPATWHPHALRHGFATAVCDTTGSVRVVADLLGHSSLDTAMIYTHVLDTTRISAVEAIL